MLCAAIAGQRGRRVVLIDHARHIGEKIRISGGGRCNFTNLHATAAQYIGEDPGFAREALTAYGPRDFIGLVRRHGVAFHEKHKGQLFCNDDSRRIIELLRAECAQGRVEWRQPCRVTDVGREGSAFRVDTEAGAILAARVVVATGGLPVPRIGASDYGLRLARDFGLRVVEPRPALVPLTFAPADWKPFAALAGVAREVVVRCGAQHFLEDLLFTHRGLSGPAILQISSTWNPGDALQIDLAPGADLGAWLREEKSRTRQSLLGALASRLPRRLAETWIQEAGMPGQQRLAELGDARLVALGRAIDAWTVRPAGTQGWNKAEVMRGGVATDELDPLTLVCRRVPGLHFIGEVVDVTGWLGGYNFQWAWSSGRAAAMAV